MGNSLFGSRAMPGSNAAELTEHPMVRYNSVTAPTEGRYREIPERFGDSSHRNDIQLFRTEPKRYSCFSEFGYLPGALRKSSCSLSHLLMSSC